jgi:N-acylneuraminate cytidylyltransferase
VVLSGDPGRSARPSTVAIVPARGGSKGIPRKNLVPVGGRSLLQWAIDAARASTLVDRVIVTTDDEEIAAAARDGGAEVPFLRPAELALDATTDLPVFQHAVAWLDEHGTAPDVVVHLRPTSPSRRPGLVDQAVARLLEEPSASSLRSVSPAPHTPWKMWEIDGDYLRPLLGTMEQEAFNQPRQALPPAWLHDGVIDVIRSEVIRSGSMTGPRVLAWRSLEDEAVDIDRPQDLAEAEAALARLDRSIETRPGSAGDGSR